MSQKRKVFGTDGVRGRANHFPMTVEMALALGRAAGKVFRKHNGAHRVVIGKDTRLSCYMFENALISGLCSMGINTLMLGPFPTPGVAFITRAYRADAGVVISASHNSFEDNGIKFFSSEGFKLPDEVELEMERLVEKADFSDSLPNDFELGKNSKVTDADGRYIEYLKSTFPKTMNLNGLKIVLDCANGAAYKVAPLVFRELGAEVFVYGDRPNGLNINQGCGSLHPEVIQKAVIDHHADIGIALDGDGDRLIVVDDHAQILDGDAILGICARDMKEKGVLKNNTIVSTVMSNFGFLSAMKQLDIDVVQSQVGDRYVLEEMKRTGAMVGGEPSGHLIFLENNTTGDGIGGALELLRIMIETDTKLSDLKTVFEPTPQAMINVPVSNKPPLESLPQVQKRLDQMMKKLDGAGRVLMRYSGTENVCRVMVEGPKSKVIESMASELAEEVKREIGSGAE